MRPTSGSTTARVSIQTTPEELIVTVADQGRGMPQPLLIEDDDYTKRFGVGIMGLFERVKQSGGSMRIQSNNHGTAVTATLPREGSRKWQELAFS